MNLTYFEGEKIWDIYENIEAYIVEQFPTSLKYLNVNNKFLLEPNVLAQCNNFV